VVLRWVFDPPDSPAALRRTAGNLERLTTALEELAQRQRPPGPLPDTVQVQFARLGPVSPAMTARLTALGVTALCRE
jgi:hypothetical protein